ncbi:MAG: DNA polymerase III subunit delta' [Flavobacteriales bacterium]|nr:DNA polymerase III subunit delta' [Flavobacteriales bacterium]
MTNIDSETRVDKKKEAQRAIYLLLTIMWYKEIIGQKSIVHQLDDALKNNRIAHAQLFIGKAGSGTLQLALAYIKAIVGHVRNGEFLEQGDAISCGKMDRFIHPDVHFVYPVNKTNEISSDKLTSDNFIEHWRTLVSKNPFIDIHDWYQQIGIGNKQGLISVNESSDILKKLSLKPFEGDYKVMLIWLPEKMNSSAANKLLKILEEPPSKTVFILVSENADQIIPTILSRTQIIRVPPLATEDIEQALLAQQASPTDAAQIARLSNGDFNRALSLVNNDGASAVIQEKFREWMRLCFAKKVAELLKWSESFSKNTREDIKTFLEYGLHLFRESLIMNYGSEEVLKTAPNEEAFLLKFAPFVNQANCITFINEFEKAIRDIERNANGKILFFDLSIKVMQQIRIKPTEE